MTISLTLIARAALPFDLAAGPYPSIPDVPVITDGPSVPWGGASVPVVRWGGE